MEIPTEFDQITAEWLTGVMDIDDTVESVEWHRIAEGVGLLGRLARVELTWTRSSGPTSVIAKMQSAIPEMVEMAQMFGFYDREINFYQQANIVPDVRTPKCWHVEADPEAVPFVIVMEDLAEARIVDQLQGCSIDDALRVARGAARLHAPLWAKPELQELSWLPACNGPLYSAAQPVLQGSLPAFIERWEPLIGSEACELANGVANNLNALQNLAAEGPLTMCHYDLRLDNLLFDDGAEDVALIDFQLMASQRGPYDLAYFLGWSMTPEQRRTHTEEVLDEYTAELGRLGVEADRDWVTRVFRESMLFVVAMGITTGVDAVTENERGDALVEALIVRASIAAADLNSAEFLPT